LFPQTGSLAHHRNTHSPKYKHLTNPLAKQAENPLLLAPAIHHTAGLLFTSSQITAASARALPACAAHLSSWTHRLCPMALHLPLHLAQLSTYHYSCYIFDLLSGAKTPFQTPTLRVCAWTPQLMLLYLAKLLFLSISEFMGDTYVFHTLQFLPQSKYLLLFLGCIYAWLNSPVSNLRKDGLRQPLTKALSSTFHHTMNSTQRTTTPRSGDGSGMLVQHVET